VRWIYPTLLKHWDGGAVRIDGIVSEGDEIAGFRVIDFPGHAPGQIGLWRESDRLAIVSDTVYFVDSTKFKELPEGEASVPHPVWNWDTGAAKESIRKLAALEPAKVYAGHALQIEGPGVKDALSRAAERY
jgi:glyoxylase-like metal-dependent hydrolase (beta-lactamase superfamily II)